MFPMTRKLREQVRPKKRGEKKTGDEERT